MNTSSKIKTELRAILSLCSELKTLVSYYPISQEEQEAIFETIEAVESVNHTIVERSPLCLYKLLDIRDNIENLQILLVQKYSNN